MKKLTVTQQLNQEWLSHPEQGKHVYLVTQVINSITPKVHGTLSELEVDGYCADEDWTVTVK